MTKVTDVYGEGYKNLLSASILKENPDLAGTYTIQNAVVRKIGKGDEAQDRIVLDIGLDEYDLVVNATNARELEKKHGEEIENWVGKNIEIKLGRSAYMGKPVDSIFVEPK